MMVLTLINQNKKSENANSTTIRNKKIIYLILTYYHRIKSFCGDY